MYFDVVNVKRLRVDRRTDKQTNKQTNRTAVSNSAV